MNRDRPDSAQILARLRARGFSITLTERGTIAVRPASLLTEEEKATIAAHKEDLVAQLAMIVAASASVAPPPAPKSERPKDGPNGPKVIPLGDAPILGPLGPSNGYESVS